MKETVRRLLGLRLGSLVKLHLHEDEQEEEEKDGSDGRRATGGRGLLCRGRQKVKASRANRIQHDSPHTHSAPQWLSVKQQGTERNTKAETVGGQDPGNKKTRCCCCCGRKLRTACTVCPRHRPVRREAHCTHRREKKQRAYLAEKRKPFADWFR